MALAHNIRAYARAIALVEIVRKKEQIKCKIYFWLNYSTTPAITAALNSTIEGVSLRKTEDNLHQFYGVR